MLLFGLVKGIIREHGIWYPAANGLLGVGRHFTYGRILNIEHIATSKWAKWGGPSKCRSRSEEHTSELQSLMRISYAVFCLKTKNIKIKITNTVNNEINNVKKTL